MSQTATESQNDKPKILVAVNTAVGFGRGVLTGVIAFNRMRHAWDLTMCPIWDIETDGLASLIDGAILQVDPDTADALAADGPPTVNVDDSSDHYPLPSVVNDNLAIGQHAALHLLDRGFRNFAFHGETGRHYSDQRLAGFRAVLAKHGRSVHVSPDVVDSPDPNSPFVHWLHTLPTPAGVLTCHDAAGHALVEAAIRHERRIPEDFAVLGVDNDQMICEMCTVPLSSVATAAERIGFAAAATLHRLLRARGDRTPPTVKRIPPLHVVTRRSSDVLAVNDPDVVAAIRYIREHLSDRFGVSDVVGQLSISRRHLEARFQQTLGRSPGAEIRRQRMDRACELLQTTDLPIRDVGRACGYHEIALFSKAFRQSMDTTATAYRKASRLSASADIH